MDLTPREKEGFLSRIHKTDGCWYFGKPYAAKHRTLWVGDKQVGASKVAYLLFKGLISEGQWVLHTCDVGNCVNPAHLYLGSPKQNSEDRDKRGRANRPTGLRHGQHTCPESRTKGEKNGMAKLQEGVVRQVMEMGKAGVKQRDIAEKFGLKQPTVSRLLSGKSWRHLYEEIYNS